MGMPPMEDGRTINRARARAEKNGLLSGPTKMRPSMKYSRLLVLTSTENAPEA